MIIAIFSLISGIFLSLVSAYFSVIGFSDFFGGFILPIIIMASFLEIAKISAALWLHKHWEDGPKKIKNYLLFSVIILMFITSLGIFSFLSKTHSEINKDIFLISSQLSTLENKLTSLQNNKNFYINSINVLDKEIETLRLNNRITQSIQTRQRQQNERNFYLEQIKSIDNEIMDTKNQITELQSKSIIQNVKLGPINYFISFVNTIFSVNISTDKASIIFIFLIIFVFDPVAICLLIASHWSFMKIKNEKNSVVRDNFVLFLDCFIEKTNFKFYTTKNEFFLHDYFFIKNKKILYDLKFNNNMSLNDFSLYGGYNTKNDFFDDKKNNKKSMNDVFNFGNFEFSFDYNKNNLSVIHKYTYDSQNINFYYNMNNKNINYFCEKNNVLSKDINATKISQDMHVDMVKINENNKENNLIVDENNNDLNIDDEKKELNVEKNQKINNNISEQNNDLFNNKNPTTYKKNNTLNTSEIEFNFQKWIVERPSLK